MIRGKCESLLLESYNSFNRIKGPSEIYSSSVFNQTKPLNHPDYEEYKFKPHRNIIGGDYIVFCDDYFPYHTDNIYFFNVKELPDGEKYHKTMIEYFDSLEQKYGIPVVIAAHPKSDYKSGTFGNRKIIKYHTADLTYNAAMVTLHLCNSISYSILANKPVAFITTDDYYLLPNVKHNFKNLAENTLNLRIYNLDHCDMDDIEFKRIDSTIRENYIYNYLTSKQTENILNGETLRTSLSEL